MHSSASLTVQAPHVDVASDRVVQGGTSFLVLNVDVASCGCSGRKRTSGSRCGAQWYAAAAGPHGPRPAACRPLPSTVGLVACHIATSFSLHFCSYFLQSFCSEYEPATDAFSLACCWLVPGTVTGCWICSIVSVHQCGVLARDVGGKVDLGSMIAAEVIVQSFSS